MRVLVLVLSGDGERAREDLQQKYAHDSIQFLSRYELENKTAAQRLSIVRGLRPDVFIIVTERLVWQRGQNALFAFGALAGARDKSAKPLAGKTAPGNSSSFCRHPFALCRSDRAGSLHGPVY